MATIEREYETRVDVARTLARLRDRIRRFIWLDTTVTVVLWSAIAFWISCALDWLIEPPVAVRALALAAFIAFAAVLKYRHFFRRIWRPLSDQQLALVLERRFGAFQESLITSVELDDVAAGDDTYGAQMLQSTRQQAARVLPSVELDRVLDYRGLRRRGVIAGLLAASVLLFALLATTSFSVWFQRNVLLSNIPWPRRTYLSIDGFPGGRVKIARGSDLELFVRAAASHETPDNVEVRYQTAEGTRGREIFQKIGTGGPSASDAGVANPDSADQQFVYTFKSVLSPMTFDIVGGDARIRNLEVDVVDSPVLNEMSLSIQYPSYLRREPRTQRVAGTMQVPRGSKIELQGSSNKDLRQVVLSTMHDQKSKPLATIDMAQASDHRKFRYPLGVADTDQTLLVDLVDADGIRTREPIRVFLVAQPDDPPKLALRLQGVGAAITQNARIPFVGEVSDDYGVAQLWYEYNKLSQPGTILLSHQTPSGRTELTLNKNSEAFDVKELQQARTDGKSFSLQPGERLMIKVNASDTCALTAQPNIGQSEQFQFEIVTPEVLMSSLESRELMLRRRLEVAIREMTEARDLLATQPGAQAGGATGEGVRPADSGQEPGERSAGLPVAGSPEAVPGSPAASTAPAVVAKAPLELLGLQADRALQASERNAHETRLLAEGFGDILEEMINNRVDTPELQNRLRGQIAQPLSRLSEVQFPELERRLRLVRESGDLTAGAGRLGSARQQADLILTEMKLILDKMLELETFNEVVEMLRSVIQKQETVNKATGKQQKAKLRDLGE